MGLVGSVRNDAHGAAIEVEGSPRQLDRFLSTWRDRLPALATVRECDVSDVPARDARQFEIDLSDRSAAVDAQVTVDLATCEDCLRELLNPSDRRYRYPFINCTNCGPRYTIIQKIPYDRCNTTMHRFTLCAACQREYDDPMDRRFHAQPNACPKCGPRLWWADAQGQPQSVQNPIDHAADQLLKGSVIAIKGLGGFHLACRADNDAVERLRRRKHRESKPLALMVASLEHAARYSNALRRGGKRTFRPISADRAAAGKCRGVN